MVGGKQLLTNFVLRFDAPRLTVLMVASCVSPQQNAFQQMESRNRIMQAEL
jgi:hypothetical protein